MADTSTCLIITGMHRSGTSLVAGILGQQGLDLGTNLIPPMRANPRGFFENPDLMQLHDTLLAEAGQAWNSPTLHDWTCPTDADRIDRLRVVVERTRGGRSDGCWGWKDPRACLFLPLWDAALPAARWVFVLRYPAQVVWSLLRRGDRLQLPDGSPLDRAERALNLWTEYTRRWTGFAEGVPERSYVVEIPADIPGLDLGVAVGGEPEVGQRADPAATTVYEAPLLHVADVPAWIAELVSADREVSDQFDRARALASSSRSRRARPDTGSGHRPGRVGAPARPRMRFLFSSVAAYGHLQPMLGLAVAAQRAGHEVVVATGRDLVPTVEANGLVAWPVGLAGPESVRRYAAAYPDAYRLPPDERLGMVARHLFAEIVAPACAADLVPRAEDWKPDFLVHDLAELAAPIVAARTGAVRLVHGFGPMLPTELFDLTTALEPLYDRWGVAHLASDRAAATYLDICPPSLHLPGPTPWPNVQALRPSIVQPVNDQRLPEEMAALPYPETLHLTLGTIFNTSGAVLRAALAGVGDLPLNVVVTVGPSVDPRSLGDQPPHILVRQFIPLALLLPHCRLVVSHGGAGTMLGALAYGLPQVLLPQGAEEHRNAEACQRAGAAIVVPPSWLTRAGTAVGAAVERLLAEPSFTAAAVRVAGEIEALPAPDRVVAALEVRRRPRL